MTEIKLYIYKFIKMKFDKTRGNWCV